jgi:threonine synthase
MSNLYCLNCDKHYSITHPIWRCSCGGLLDIEHKASFPKKEILSRPKGMWRYREAIPINHNHNHNIISFDEGFTPLKKEHFFGREILVKNDSLFTTHSYKDRGASVLISKIKELGIKSVVEDSSGNAGSAVACYCKKAGIDCDIFVPATTSDAKLMMIENSGARLHKITGSRENTFEAAFKQAQKTYYASHSWNPFFFQGTKTCAFEIWEQMNWKAPDTVIVPVGNGTLLIGMYKGFHDLMLANEISKIPRIIAVQAQNCAPLLQKDLSNFEKLPTIAEGIAIAEPVRRNQIIEAVEKSGGYFIAVTEDEISQGVVDAGNAGYPIEPTSGTVLAALKKQVDTFEADEQVVVVLTGHGVKIAH